MHTPVRKAPKTMNRALPTGYRPGPSWIPTKLGPFLDPRTLVAMGLVLSYVWRFHDLSPILAPLRLAAVFTVASWGYLIVAPRFGMLKKALSYPYIWPFFAWSAWMVIGVPHALSPHEASDYLIQVHLKTATMFLFLLGFFNHRSKIGILAVTHLFGASVLCFFYAKSGFPTEWTPVPMHDRNDLALILVMVAPLALFIAQTDPRKKVRIAAAISGTIIGGSAVLTQSRGGFLAILAVVLYYMFRAQDVGWKVRVVPPVLLLVGLMIAPPAVKTRLETILHPRQDYNYEDPGDGWLFGKEA